MDAIALADLDRQAWELVRLAFEPAMLAGWAQQGSLAARMALGHIGRMHGTRAAEARRWLTWLGRHSP